MILISDGDVDAGAVELKKTMESEDKVVLFSALMPWDAMGIPWDAMLLGELGSHQLLWRWLLWWIKHLQQVG